MKKLLIIILIAFGINTKSQIVWEHTYDSASTSDPFTGANQLMIIKFEVSGERYVKINRMGASISIYDMNHSLLKTISMASFPMCGTPGPGDVLYLSEKLFDPDDAMEFMYISHPCGASSPNAITNIYKEDGTIIFSDTGAALIRSNIPLQQYPIYNTSQDTKMILSYRNGQAKVFGLPGTLTTGIQEGNAQLVQAQGGQFSNLFPNPGSGKVTLQYELPKGETEGEIILYNQQGTEVKRYKVDGAFKNIIIDNTQLSQGTYIYQLVTSKGAVGVKKMVVVK